MIKNIMIALLSLAVIALFWITLSGTSDNQEALSQLKDKIDMTKRQISEAYKTAKQEPRNGTGDPSIDKKPGRIEERQETEDGKTVYVNRQTEASAADSLNSIKQQSKENPDSLSSQDLNSILLILKSAQNFLRKTPFTNPKDTEEDVTSGNAGPQSTSIKKKLSAGLVE